MLVVLVSVVCHVDVSLRFFIIELVESVFVCMFTPVNASIPAQINPGIRNTQRITAYAFSVGISLVIDVSNIIKLE